ncbi:MAG: methionine adenosyltransferase domain-containing protein [Rickettsiales bacterium]|jgi:S-adenosylmethionine synthetase|nr:methionine adenosyltransferase domain-containing protein [Rickettsiales bacterium]
MTENYSSAEYVSVGHPDRIADSVSNGVLLHLLQTAKDPRSVRGGIEVQNAWTKGITYFSIAGELKSDVYNEQNRVSNEVLYKIVEDSLHFIGYDTSEYRAKFTKDEAVQKEYVKVNNYLNIQASHIALATDKVRTGDQGIYWGYAVNESSTYESLPLFTAKRINGEVYNFALKSKSYGIDIKTQATFKYINDKPVELTHFVLALPTSTINPVNANYRDELIEFVKNNLKKILPANIKYDNIKWYINSTGDWTGTHGSIADAGTTGRKLSVVSTGGHRLGGGNMQAKDATKSDVSANLYARYLAKNIVKSGFADSAEVGLATSIGLNHLFGLEIHLLKNGKEDNILANKIAEYIKKTPEYNNYQTLIEKVGAFGTRELPAPNSVVGVFGDEKLAFEKLDFAIQL